MSELSDSNLEIGYDAKNAPKEIIFADLKEGSYFGELSLTYKGKNAAKAACQEVRNGICYTSVWAIQNTHFFYLEDKVWEEILEILRVK